MATPPSNLSKYRHPPTEPEEPAGQPNRKRGGGKSGKRAGRTSRATKPKVEIVKSGGKVRGSKMVAKTEDAGQEKVLRNGNEQSE